MKTIITTIVLFITFVSNAQNFEGTWHGLLEVQTMKLRLNFNITKTADGYTSTMDSPDQGANGLPTTSTKIDGNNIEITYKEAQITYTGTLEKDSIKGTFKQGLGSMPLNLSRKAISSEATKQASRPQDPQKPFPYASEEVTFVNKKANNIKLAGTLTFPKQKTKPAVAILISGSGPQNRDEEIKAFNHRPFLVLSDYLTRNGIAVLRYDDRGVAQSEGTQKDATSVDFATDVQAAIDYLKTRNDIDTSKIGLIGHSEGGLIAQIVAKESKDIAFIVSLAGPGVKGSDVLKLQSNRSLELSGANQSYIEENEKINTEFFKIINNSKNATIAKDKLLDFYKDYKTKNPKSEILANMNDEKFNSQIKTLANNWMYYFLNSDPQKMLSKIKVPFLALNGEKDFQVDAKQNLDGLKKGLKKNKDATFIELKDLNHLFQTSETGAITEYGKIEETFNENAMKIVADWINKRF